MWGRSPHGGGGVSERSERAPARRTGAEWTSFAVACTIIAALVGLLVWDLVANIPVEPAAFRVDTGTPRTEDGAHYVDVTVENTGDETAENVQVIAELSMGRTVVAESDQTLDLISGGGSRDLTFVFETDPSAGDLVVRVAGHEVP